MVKASDINKDIRSIGEKVGVAVFSYDDIHNENINNEFHYDYERVIAEVSRLQKIAPEEAEAQLVKRGVLRPLPGGEYEVDVGGSTRNGGGINYGSAFFSLSSKDYQIKYHELGHSLQDKYGLFDDEKMNRLYETAEKGLKNGENKEDKLLDRGNYHQYLMEMHSETFAYAALMLRAENRRDFLWQASQAYNSAISRNVDAALSFGKTEYSTDGGNNSKFYATKPVMKPMIKAIWKIRKEGRQGEFFDENGVLKDEKLARLCEEVVVKNAYSPRTLKSFFEYNVLDGHTGQEKGWRGDTLKSLVQMPLSMIGLLQEGDIKEKFKSIFRHEKLVAEQNKKVEKFASKRVDYGNPELTALKEYERIQTKIGIVDRKFPENYIALTFGENIRRTGLPDCSIRFLANWYGENSSEKKAIEKELKSVRKIMTENKGNPYFEKLLQAEPKSNELRQMIREKQQNPQKEVTSGLVGEKRCCGLATYPLGRNVKKINLFAEKYQLDPVIKKSLLDTMVKNPQALDDVQNRDVLISAHRVSNDFLGIKKRKFVKEFNQLMDGIGHSYYSNRGNPLYQEAMSVLSKQPVEKYAEKVAEMEKQERKAVKNKEPVRFMDEKPVEQFQEPSVKKQEMRASQEQAQEPIVKESSAQAQVQEAAVPQPKLSPREQVDAEMAKHGIAKGSYMLFSSEDKNLETGYGTDSLRKVDAYLHNQKGAQEAGTDKIMGQNNGLTAVYFAKEDVYLVTANPEVAEAMRYSGCKDVGLGVMFSNGERLVNDAAKLAEWQQVRNMGENIAQKKWEEQRRRDEQVQEAAVKPAAETVISAAEKMSNQPQGWQQAAASENPAVENVFPIEKSVAASASVKTAESNSANLKKLLLEKSGRLSAASSAPVQKNGTSLQAAKLRSAAYDR